MHSLQLGKIKQQVATVVQLTLQDVLTQVKNQDNLLPGESLGAMIDRLTPDHNSLVELLDQYFKQKYPQPIPQRYTKIAKIGPPPQIPSTSPDTVPENKTRKKGKVFSDKYIELQSEPTSLCKFTTDEWTGKGELYLHLENNWLFVEKKSHYICVGTFNTTSNSIEWFPQYCSRGEGDKRSNCVSK